MSEETQLAERPNFNLAAGIDAVRFEQNRLVFDRPLTTDETIKLLRFAVASDDAVKFWMGDLLLHILENKGEESAREAARNFTDKNEAWDCMRTCQALVARYENPSYKSHRSALDECRGDAQKADYWLRMADKHGWEPEQLRVQIRRSNAELSDTTSDKGSPTLTSMIRKLGGSIAATIKNRPVEEWSLEEVSGIMRDMEPILSVQKAIKKRWEEFNPKFF